MGRSDGGGSDGNIDGGLHGCGRDSGCATVAEASVLGGGTSPSQDLSSSGTAGTVHSSAQVADAIPNASAAAASTASWVSATSGAGAQRIQFCREGYTTSGP